VKDVSEQILESMLVAAFVFFAVSAIFNLLGWVVGLAAKRAGHPL
jgi:putative Mn2+ efflux pump MntP